MKTLKQLLKEIKKNKGYEEMTDQEILYFAVYNLYLDIRILNNNSMTWDEFRKEIGYHHVHM